MEWELYLSRPFDLFTTTVWNEWYQSNKFKELFGVRFEEGIFIESPRGISCHYRRKGDLMLFKNSIENIALNNLEKTREILHRAEELNLQAQELISSNLDVDIQYILNFLIDLALHSTIFPMFAGELLSKKNINSEILFLCNKLRSVSFYPMLLSKVLMPKVERLFVERSLDPADIKMITIREIISGDYTSFLRRKSENMNKFFVIEYNYEKMKTYFVNDPKKLIQKINFVEDFDGLIKGQVAYGGFTTGIVRIVLDNNLNISFNDNDVLVSISTNPNIIPLIKKSSAIITDEGGITSHAAIIAREMQKPCIIGTKIATQVLKDGMEVEVDANSGVVRIIK